jgi:uncharacterized OB-fold protein
MLAFSFLTECQIVSNEQKQVPIAEGLYTWPSSHPQLIASKCKACGEVAFPSQGSCPSCTGDATEDVLLSRSGKLWTWTIQHFPPPHPYISPSEKFEPFGVGYIELAEGIRVESRLTVSDPAQLEIGMTMELVIEKYMDAEDGSQLMTYAFAPVHESA